MPKLKNQDQGIIELLNQDHLSILIDSFLIDRRSQGLSPETIDFYSKKLKYFLKYCEGQALTRVSQLSTDLIRRYILELSETHNPGGVHACFRPLRTLLYWVEEEGALPDDCEACLWQAIPLPARRLLREEHPRNDDRIFAVAIDSQE
jgi:site-specific recombinase XerD